MYTLYSHGTPNGIKPTIMLEELAQPYTIKAIDISKREQFAPEFLKISPNNKIPVLHDQEHDFYLFESVAILQYLAEKHGKIFTLIFSREIYRCGMVLFSSSTHWPYVRSIWSFSLLCSGTSPLCHAALCR